jgi:hypothetical protein
MQHRWQQLGLGPTERPHLARLRGPGDKVVFHDDKHVHDGESKVADQLAKEVRVLCWVMTAPWAHKNKVPPRCIANLFCSRRPM